MTTISKEQIKLLQEKFDKDFPEIANWYKTFKPVFILYKNNLETKTTSIQAVKVLCDKFGWKIKHNKLSELV